jgi:hypothetical protein
MKLNTNVPAFLLGVLLAGAMASSAEAKEKRERSCYQCGTIEAVIPRIVPVGHNGFFAYDLIIKMDETGLTRRVPVGTVGAMDVGDRVSLMGGTVTPVL